MVARRLPHGGRHAVHDLVHCVQSCDGDSSYRPQGKQLYPRSRIADGLENPTDDCCHHQNRIFPRGIVFSSAGFPSPHITMAGANHHEDNAAALERAGSNIFSGSSSSMSNISTDKLLGNRESHTGLTSPYQPRFKG